jgi:tetratricopeptide (TPR) repeat protein
VSQSPLESRRDAAQAKASIEPYQLGWVAIHKLLRDGLSWSGRERHVTLWNGPQARFVDVSGLSGLDLPEDGRAAAAVDWDRDGDLDLWVTSRGSPRVRLFANAMERGGSAAGSSLAVRLVSSSANRHGIGARVEVRRRSAPTLWDSRRAGEGFLAQGSAWLHFGMGDARDVEDVIVHWPGGAVESFSGVAAGGRWILEQGLGQATADAHGPARTLGPSAPPTSAPASARAHVRLAGRYPLPPLSVLDAQGKESSWAPPAGRPQLVAIWASWCQPCRTELRSLVEWRAELEQLGLGVVALDADQEADRPRARELLRELGWPYPAAHATSQTLDVLDWAQRAATDRRLPLALPISFLLDAEGALAAIYRGPAPREVLRADVAALRGSAVERRAHASAAEGRWLNEPVAADLLRIASLMEAAGLERAARFYREASFQRRETSPAEVTYQMGLALARGGQMDRALEQFQRALVLEPGHLEAAFALGTALHEKGRLDPAIQAYDRVLRGDGRHVGALYNLALAQRAAGDGESSLQTAATLEVLDPAAATKLRAQLSALTQSSKR